MSAHPAVSPRAVAAQELADVCVFGGLSNSASASVTKSVDHKNKSHWAITFAVHGHLAGVIRVYSDRFIMIKTQGPASRPQQVFKSTDEARRFLVTNFVKVLG